VLRYKKKAACVFSCCDLNRGGCVNYSANRGLRKLAIYLAGCAIADRFPFPVEVLFFFEKALRRSALRPMIDAIGNDIFEHKNSQLVNDRCILAPLF
jgi:hypothetical protein